MPAKDVLDDAVRNALVKDGWTITPDPYAIEFEDAYVFIDLGAERGADRIAVEIKTFPHKSAFADLHPAVGQFVVYRTILDEVAPSRWLYLAVSDESYEKVFQRPSISILREKLNMSLLVVSLNSEEIAKWIESPTLP